ncbi:MAG: EamA family transporter [Clostridiales bacterium]|nr:EamA family transporter [Clostridiales bacterium]
MTTGQTKPGLGVLLVVAGCALWSFSGVLSKWTPWGPLSIVGIRAVSAALVFGWLRGDFRVRLTRGNWLGAVGVAFTSLLFVVATKMTTAANAIVLQYAMPVFVILACYLLFGQKPSGLDIAAAVVTMVGVALCFVSGLTTGNPAGDALALLSAVTFSMVFFAARMPDADPMDYVYLGNLLLSVFVFTIPFDEGFIVTVPTVMAALALCICLTGGYLLFSQGMKAGVSPVAAAIVANIEPVLNPIWVFLALGEMPGWLTIWGALLVIGAVTAYGILNARRTERGMRRANASKST